MDTITTVDVNPTYIEKMIFTLRNQQVIFDFDVAWIYGYEVKTLNQQVKRNITRFPEDFMFQLNKEEIEFVRSQIVTSRGRGFFSGQMGGRRTPPYAFTEQGIYMLGSVLRGEVAEKQTIKVMRAFKEMRHFIANNAMMFERISKVELRQLEYQKQSEEKFDKIFEYISGHEESSQKIFFEGQIFDAYSLLVDLFRQAKERITLIDGYADKNTLDIVSKKKSDVHVTIYTYPSTKLTDKDISKFNAQYPKLEVKYVTIFHDRFLIIDDNIGYHIGASIKDAGKKCFGINRIEDNDILKDVIKKAETAST